LVIIVSNKRKQIDNDFQTVFAERNGMLLNKYDSKDCLDYNNSNSDVQKVCQILKLYHKLV